MESPVRRSHHMLKRRPGKIAARVVAEKFVHAPPQCRSTVPSYVGRHQHVGEIPERASRRQGFLSEGIGRVFYCFAISQRVVILHAFVKKTPDTPESELKIARKRMKEVQNG